MTTELVLPRSACIVVFDDDQGTCVLMGWDSDCEGALCARSPAVVFPNRRAAQRAITISRRFALLQEAQGKPENTDFMPECRACIKIVSVEAA